MAKKIVDSTIAQARYMNEVTVTYDDGSKEMLFKYYPDELYFEEKEFVGLTAKQALELFHQRDIAYLQS
jgi:hypothetical protein